MYLVHPDAVSHGKYKRAESGEQDEHTVQAKDWPATECKLFYTFLVGHQNPYHKQDYVNKYIDKKPRE